MSEYVCPQCDGRLTGGVCKDCGLDINHALEHLEENNGPLSNIAYQLQGAIHE